MMPEAPGSFRSLLRRWLFLGACLLAVLWIAAAGPARAQQAASSPVAPAASAAPQNKVQADSAAQEREKEKKDRHLAASDAEELFHSADSILKFASDDTRLPILHPVKRQLASRDQVEKYVEEQMRQDQESGRFKRAQSVLQKFGLIPRDLQLEPLMVELMREQVAGYYDPKKQTFYMLDWIAPESQRPVIAHELTHALQDQTVGLEKWLKEEDLPEGDKDDSSVNLSSDEQMTARTAVSEGQATAVMLDYLLQPGGRTVVTAQDYVTMFEDAMLQSSNFPVFNNAPLYIKASLTFPYRYGLDFVRNVLIDKGRENAFRGLLEHPPSTTREVMEPKVYLAGEKVEPMRLPPLSPILGKRYTRYDIGVMGEFDVDILLQQFAGEKTAHKLSPCWRGGYYYAAVRQEAMPAGAADAKSLRKQAVPTTSLAMLYVSRWDSSESAEKFAQAYAATLPQRYKFAQRAPENPDPKDFGERVANHTKWLTDEGAVFVESWGQTVLVMESFDDQTAAQIREAVLGRGPETAEDPAAAPAKP